MFKQDTSTPVPEPQQPVSPSISQQTHHLNSSSTTRSDLPELRKRLAELLEKKGKYEEGILLDTALEVLQEKGVASVEQLVEMRKSILRIGFRGHVVRDILLYLPFFINALPPVQNTIKHYMTAADVAYGPWTAFLVNVFATAVLPACGRSFIWASTKHLSPRHGLQSIDINPHLRSPSGERWQTTLFIFVRGLPKAFEIPTVGLVAWVTPALHIVAFALYVMFACNWVLLRSEPPPSLASKNVPSPAQESTNKPPAQASTNESPAQASKKE